MGDGRFDAERILAVAKQFAKRAILFDAGAAARAAGVPINAVLFGTIVACRVLRLERAWAEEAIRRSGKAVEANLRGLEIGIREASVAVLPEASKAEVATAHGGWRVACADVGHAGGVPNACQGCSHARHRPSARL